MIQLTLQKTNNMRLKNGKKSEGNRMEIKTNYYHNKLVALGQIIIKDEYWSTSHIYAFSCGCKRTYYIDVWGNDHETLQPCKKHKYLLEGSGK